MLNVFFEEILIYDKFNHLAKKQTFDKGINLITSENNGVGKTSLSKLLLYAFGAKVSISDNWKKLNNIFTKLKITANNVTLTIVRFKDTYKIITVDTEYNFTRQEDYNKKLYELIGLTIKIKSKNSDDYINAVPSIYLLPNYIAQMLTYEEISVFDDLKMYDIRDVRDTFYYHVGTLDSEYIKTIQEITKNEQSLKLLNSENKNLTDEIAYLTKKLSENKNIIPIENDSIEDEVKLYNNLLTHKKERHYAVDKSHGM